MLVFKPWIEIACLLGLRRKPGAVFHTRGFNVWNVLPDNTVNMRLIIIFIVVVNKAYFKHDCSVYSRSLGTLQLRSYTSESLTRPETKIVERKPERIDDNNFVIKSHYGKTFDPAS